MANNVTALSLTESHRKSFDLSSFNVLHINMANLAQPPCKDGAEMEVNASVSTCYAGSVDHALQASLPPPSLPYILYSKKIPIESKLSIHSISFPSSSFYSKKRERERDEKVA